jgi:hypothetical protein
MPAPEVGCDIPDAHGRVLGAAELAWPDQRIAVFIPSQERDLLTAAQLGWRTLFLDDGAQCARDLTTLWCNIQEPPR